MFTAIAKFLSPYLVPIAIGAGIVIAITSFAGGYKLRDYQAKAEENEELKAAQKALDDAITARADLEKKRHEEAVDFEKRYARLRAEKSKTQIVKVNEYAKPDYSNCVVPSAGLQLLNESAAAVNAARAER